MHQVLLTTHFRLRLISRLAAISFTCAFLAALVLTVSPAKAADTVAYTLQTGNLNSQQLLNNNGPPYAGNFNNNSNELGQYANGGNGSTPGAAGFENFTTTGVGPTGLQRNLQVGDTFTITNYIGSNPSAGGYVGISFRTTTGSSSFSSVNDSVAEKFILYNAGGYQAVGTTANISTLGSATDTTFTIKVTSSTTFNATISDSGGTVTYYDQAFSNNPTSTTQIQSFSLFNYGDSNANTYWKNGSLNSTGTVEVGAGNGTSTIVGVIADGLAADSTTTAKVNALTKFGTGIINLTAINTYTGATAVNAGTLLINGSTNAASAVTVASVATLGGGGTIGGTVAVSGTLSPGAAATTGSVATLTTGALTLTSTASTLFDVNGVSTFDKIIVSGAVTYGGTLTIDLGSYTPTGTTTYQLFSATSAGGAFTDDASVTFDQSGYQGIFNPATGTLSITAVPEPATWLGGAMCFGLAGWTLRRGFHRTRKSGVVV